METISVADAKAHLSELLTKVEAGEEIIITRRGQPVARLERIMRPKKPSPFPSLDALRAKMLRSSIPSAELIRKVRDESY
jgi:antitoxin (DNA-binding transcriptional repressor) of toxin-antitoxin stability system